MGNCLLRKVVLKVKTSISSLNNGRRKKRPWVYRSPVWTRPTYACFLTCRGFLSTFWVAAALLSKGRHNGACVGCWCVCATRYMCTMSKDVPFKQFWFGKDIQTHKTIFWGGLFRESDSNFHINTHKHWECGWGGGPSEGLLLCEFDACRMDGKHQARHLFFCQLWIWLHFYTQVVQRLEVSSDSKAVEGSIPTPGAFLLGLLYCWSLVNEVAIAGSLRCFSCCRRRFSAVKPRAVMTRNDILAGLNSFEMK